MDAVAGVCETNEVSVSPVGGYPTPESIYRTPEGEAEIDIKFFAAWGTRVRDKA